MSNPTLPVSEYVRQIDPTIDLSRPQKIILEESADTVKYRRIASNSVSNSTVSFDAINPPSPSTVIDRKILVSIPIKFTLTFNNVANGAYALDCDGIGLDGQPIAGQTINGGYLGGIVNGNDAPRAFPLSQLLRSLTVSVNSTDFTQQLNDYIEPLMRYSNYRDLGEEDWSLTPTMQDTYQQYADYYIYGSAKNPLGNYGENGYRTPRGGFAKLSVISQVNNTTGAADPVSTGVGDVIVCEVVAQFTEPLFISPLAFGKRSSTGFYGVDTMQVVLEFDSGSSYRFWSHNPQYISGGAFVNGATLTNATYSLTNVGTNPDIIKTPEIYFTYYNLRKDQPDPERNLYMYHLIRNYPFQYGSPLAAGATDVIASSSIQLSSVPKRIFLFANERKADRSYNNPDTYARIKQVDFNFANKSAGFSQASEQQLFRIANNNGLISSWNEWSRHTGSVFCIDFSKNVSLGEDVLVGSQGTFQLDFTMTVQNMSRRAITYTVNIIVVDDGYVEIKEQEIYTRNSLGDVHNIITNKMLRDIDYQKFEMFYGAGLADTLKKYGKKAYGLAKDAVGTAKDVAKEYGPEVAKWLSKKGIDYGISGLEALLGGQELTAAQKKKIMKQLEGGGMVGGGMVGGRTTRKPRIKRR